MYLLKTICKQRIYKQRAKEKIVKKVSNICKNEKRVKIEGRNPTPNLFGGFISISDYSTGYPNPNTIKNILWTMAINRDLKENVEK